MWLIKFIPRLQPFVVLSLFIAFLLVFGLQAFKKYRSYEVYIRETVIETEGLEAPALTICVEGLYIIQETYHRFNKYFPSSPFSQPKSATEVRIRNVRTRSESVRDQDQAHFHSSQTVRH